MWVEVAGYNGLYLVNEVGEVLQTEKTIRRMPGLVKPQRTRQGYLQVQLVKGLDRKFFYVHRLVALAFVPNPDNKKQVNHINGNKKDNRVENIEWATGSENMKHAYETGLASMNSGLILYNKKRMKMSAKRRQKLDYLKKLRSL